MRIVFAGTPEFAAVSLKKLIQDGLNVVAVYTQPDRASGRSKTITFSPIKQLALKHKIPLEQPVNFKEQSTIEKFASYQADIFIVAAYGIILPQALLNICQKNINIHASLLPKLRGASPIQYAILQGEKTTGITLMEIIKALDAGPMLAQKSLAITAEHTTETLSLELANLGAQLLVDSLKDIDHLWQKREEQNHNLATHAPKITKQDALIDWQQPARTIHNQVRALSEWPKAYCYHQQTELKILQTKITEMHTDTTAGKFKISGKQLFIAAKDYYLEVLTLQIPNKKAMSAAEFLCGYANILD